MRINYLLWFSAIVFIAVVIIMGMMALSDWYDSNIKIKL
jgi:hypothetical protein